MPNLNELYDTWQNTGGAERAQVEAQMLPLVQQYARAVVWLKLAESDSDLAGTIAGEVIRCLPTFGGRSRFTTWVYGIAKNTIKQELRARRRLRDALGDRMTVEEADPDDDEEHPSLGDSRAERGLLARLTLEQLAEGLSLEDARLFHGICEGKDQNELAQDLGITPEAAESRRRRFRQELIEKLERS